jgi:hypothetical protein
VAEAPADEGTVDVRPDASAQVEINATPAQVYALISDIDSMIELSEETASFRWLGGATAATVGAKFRGTNRKGPLRWSTISTVTAAEPNTRFGFDVHALGMPVASWRYDITPTDAGCVLTESTWDSRTSVLKVVGSLASGTFQRQAANQRNIECTLQRIKARAESTG